MRYYIVANDDGKGCQGVFNTKEKSERIGLKKYMNYVVFERDLLEPKAEPAKYVTLYYNGVITVHDGSYMFKVNEHAGIIENKDSFVFIFRKDDYDMYSWLAFMKQYLYEQNNKLYKEEWVLE